MFKEPIEKIAERGWGAKIRERLCQTDVLVIDEISMAERDLFSRLDALMREARHGYKRRDKQLLTPHHRDLVFGGAQIVLTGDFCQLPPPKPFKHCLWCGGPELEGWSEPDNRDLTCETCQRTFEDRDKWAFTSRLWQLCEFESFELNHIHRQTDETFIQILLKIRLRKPLTPKEKALLMEPKPDPTGAVQLMSTKREVEEVNLENCLRLTGPEKRYHCLDVFSWRNEGEPDLQAYYTRLDPKQPDGPLHALKDHRFEGTVKLKVGMLVILQANVSFEDGLVNGSQGKVIRFTASEEGARPGANIGKRRMGRGTDDYDFNQKLDFKERSIRQFAERLPHGEWPIVEFTNGVRTPIMGHCEVREVGSEKPYSLLARVQIPLIPAWAITIVSQADEISTLNTLTAYLAQVTGHDS